MQPYFLPYLGYYSLMKHVDRYIFFDTAQYIYHGWVNRNRILKQGGQDWQYITVPVQKHAQESAIKDVAIDNAKPWREKILGQITHYKKRAPYYRRVRAWLEEALTEEHTTIGALNMALDRAVCMYLGITTPLACFSEMQLDVKPVTAPDEWALHICEAVGGVDEYWNAPGGATFFDPKKYERAGIQLRFQKIELSPYHQLGAEFQPGLSILDVMMFNSPKQIHEMLDAYTFVDEE